MNSRPIEILTDTALKWADRGVPVFPIAISPKIQRSGTNKRPLTLNGHHDASTVHADVADLFRARRPLKSMEVMGVAGVPGVAGFVVSDLDRHGGPDGVAYGDEELVQAAPPLTAEQISSLRLLLHGSVSAETRNLKLGRAS